MGFISKQHHTRCPENCYFQPSSFPSGFAETYIKAQTTQAVMGIHNLISPRPASPKRQYSVNTQVTSPSARRCRCARMRAVAADQAPAHAVNGVGTGLRTECRPQHGYLTPMRSISRHQRDNRAARSMASDRFRSRLMLIGNT